ncbi:CaiB/BaiF CoA-transferase family protein [Pusillimonas sp. ANT_WB101]|uniref:CaiB/BaiF CoA transferase family protein n=1 Tax=Pusillimonas sp. ANT_WB101 TaxID=2597356 RepID=UPI0011EDB9E6|nr:CaiB/BaiF CoA-transferase family protein [Pusillimonas sp. ANT_WB101]KAA0889300.1 CoA transferase [Pusillimonas sp. ANT_WB101]
MNEALQGIKVLDLSRILAGPWCTQMLADLGAEVIKIEHPTKGDDTRHLGPPWATDTSGQASTDATYYASTNRSKKSIGVDIATPEGAKLIQALAAKCDVFIENFKVGDLARYALDYESIKKVNPEIIYCSITGYGQTGPYANRPGYDFVFQAEGGLMSITGERDDLPGGGPQKSGVPIADLTTGLYASTAILAALNFKNTTGAGQYIDMSLLDCVAALASNQGTYHLMNDIKPHRWGNAHPALVPYQIFDASDGQIVVAVANDVQWQRLCKAIQRTDLGADARYKTATGRINHRDELLAQVEETIRAQSFETWLRVFTEMDIPHGKINDYEEVFAHPQIVHREMAVEVKNEDDDASVRLIANPIKFSRTPVQYKHSPPKLGRHTRSMLMEMLDLSEAEIESLNSRNVIRCGQKTPETHS